MIAERHGLSVSRPTLVVMAPDDYWAGYSTTTHLRRR